MFKEEHYRRLIKSCELYEKELHPDYGSCDMLINGCCSECTRVIKRLKQRYHIRRDNSGHEYAIPVELDHQFDDWLSFSEDELRDDCQDNVYVGVDFNNYRIEGGFTFTDPRD